MQIISNFVQLHKGPISQEDRMSTQNSESFIGGHQTVTLLPGAVLHRFAQGRYPLSDCWMDDETYIPLIRSIQESGRSGRSEKMKRNMIRNGLAVKTEWNRLTHRVKIVLKKPVVAYVGYTGPQSKSIVIDRSSALNPNGAEMTKKIEFRLGGEQQYVIPYFKSNAFRNNSEQYVDMPVFQPIFKHVYSSLDT